MASGAPWPIPRPPLLGWPVPKSGISVRRDRNPRFGIRLSLRRGFMPLPPPPLPTLSILDLPTCGVGLNPAVPLPLGVERQSCETQHEGFRCFCFAAGLGSCCSPAGDCGAFFSGGIRLHLMWVMQKMSGEVVQCMARIRPPTRYQIRVPQKHS